MKESTIQAAVVKYARDQGLIAIKLTSLGRFGTAGWPDYLFLGPGGLVFFIEFKAPGGALTKLQAQRHRELQAVGHTVHVCDGVAGGRLVVDREIRRAA